MSKFTNKYSISSPNNWFNKVGVKIDSQGNLTMPMKFLVVPLAEASEAIDTYKSTNKWSEKMKAVKLIALNIRQVDNAYFSNWSKSIIAANKDREIPKSFPCYECFRSTMLPKALREKTLPDVIDFRRQVNQEIIHSTENGRGFTLNYKLVTNYYDQIISLNLFHFPKVKGLPIIFCKIHKANK